MSTPGCFVKTKGFSLQALKRRTPLALTILFCLLCLLPPIMAFTYDQYSNMTVTDSSDDGEETWWLLETTGSVFADRWYFWIELIGAALIFIGVIAVLKSNRRRIGENLSVKAWAKKYLLVVCLAFVLIWAFVSALLSGDLYRCIWGTSYRHDGLFSYMIYGGAFLCAIWLAGRGRNYVRVVLECLAIVGAFSSVVIMLKINGPWLEISSDTRAGFFFQYNHQGYFNTLCWAACAALFLWDAQAAREKPKSVLTVLLAVLRTGEMWLISNAILICSVRGSFLAVCGVLILINIFLLPRKGLRIAVIVLDVLFVLTCVILNTGTDIFGRLSTLSQQIENTIESSVESSSEGSSDDWQQIGSSRGALWVYGLKFAVQNPIFGYGPDNLGKLYEATGLGTDRPHNEYIQIAAMLGFPALAAYLTGLFVHFKRFIKKRKKCSVLCMGCMLISAGYLLSAFVGNSMFYTTPYFYMCLGFSLGLFLKETEAAHE